MSKSISEEVKKNILKEVDKFNKNELKKHYKFNAEIRGKFIYLKLNNEPRGRLKYNGDLENLEFAIYKYSSSTYDSEELFFPGSGYLNGTISGALKASFEAYK